MVTFSGSPAALRAGTKPRLRKFQYEIGVAPPVVEKMKSSSSEWSVPSAPFAPGIPGGPGGPARPRAPRNPCGPRSPCSPRGPRNAVSCLLTAALRSPLWIVPSRIVSPVAVVGLVKVITSPMSEIEKRDQRDDHRWRGCPYERFHSQVPLTFLVSLPIDPRSLSPRCDSFGGVVGSAGTDLRGQAWGVDLDEANALTVAKDNGVAITYVVNAVGGLRGNGLSCERARCGERQR
jgi:hypothetical protein